MIFAINRSVVLPVVGKFGNVIAIIKAVASAQNRLQSWYTAAVLMSR